MHLKIINGTSGQSCLLFFVIFFYITCFSEVTIESFLNILRLQKVKSQIPIFLKL
jgi:hypothetical protein